jgi:hypothetical protein
LELVSQSNCRAAAEIVVVEAGKFTFVWREVELDGENKLVKTTKM